MATVTHRYRVYEDRQCVVALLTQKKFTLSRVTLPQRVCFFIVAEGTTIPQQRRRVSKKTDELDFSGHGRGVGDKKDESGPARRCSRESNPDRDPPAVTAQEAKRRRRPGPFRGYLRILPESDTRGLVAENGVGCFTAGRSIVGTGGARPSVSDATTDTSRALSSRSIFSTSEGLNHTPIVIAETGPAVPLQQSGDIVGPFEVRDVQPRFSAAGAALEILRASDLRFVQRAVEDHARPALAVQALAQILQFLGVADDTRAAAPEARTGEDVHPVEVTNAHTSVPLEGPRQYVHSVELANAHTALPLQRPGEHVRSIEVAYTRAPLALKRPRRFGVFVERLEFPVARAVTYRAARQQFRLHLDSVLLLFHRALHGALGENEALKIERALRPSGSILIVGEERHAGTDEHAVLSGTLRHARRVQRVLQTVDVEFRAGAQLQQNTFEDSSEIIDRSSFFLHSNYASYRRQ